MVRESGAGAGVNTGGSTFGAGMREMKLFGPAAQALDGVWRGSRDADLPAEQEVRGPTWKSLERAQLGIGMTPEMRN